MWQCCEYPWSKPTQCLKSNFNDDNAFLRFPLLNVWNCHSLPLPANSSYLWNIVITVLLYLYDYVRIRQMRRMMHFQCVCVVLLILIFIDRINTAWWMLIWNVCPDVRTNLDNSHPHIHMLLFSLHKLHHTFGLFDVLFLIFFEGKCQKKGFESWHYLCRQEHVCL